MASLISLLSIAIATHARGDRQMAQKKPTVYEFIPKLGQLRDDVLFGDVWEHPDLSKRDRSLITVAMLAALYRTDEMRGHMQRALDNGVTETELKGLITHVAFYAGWPCAVNAGRVAIDVFGPK
jgi:4-carboxymuconolactone decarboxylase